MSWIAPSLVGRIPVSALANPPALVELFAETIVEELDFRLEADNMLDIARILAETDQRALVVPRPHPTLVTRRVLVMERLDGFGWDDVAGMHAAGIDTSAVVRASMIAFLEGAMLYGVFHGDLHGGNLFVQADGRVALLDYGITGRLDEPQRLAFLRLLMGGTVNDVKLQLAALRDLGALPPDTDLDAVMRDLGVDQPVKDPTQMAPEELIAEIRDLTKALLGLRRPDAEGADAVRQGPAVPRRGAGHAGPRRRPVRRDHRGGDLLRHPSRRAHRGRRRHRPPDRRRSTSKASRRPWGSPTRWRASPTATSRPAGRSSASAWRSTAGGPGAAGTAVVTGRLAGQAPPGVTTPRATLFPLMLKQRTDLRNVAIVAHVDHGKTTLVDGMLRQSGAFGDHQLVADRVMDSMDLEREKGITILAKNTAVRWGGVKINIVDTPGHADFGGEVERGLTMVDGVLLLVDASEGPLPQTRFVLRKALEARLPVILVVNKVDRADARPSEVVDEVYELFIDLGATDSQIDFPIVYCNARGGQAAMAAADVETTGDLKVLFELLLEHIPAPVYDDGHPFQALVTNMDASPYVGRLALCRIRHGWVRKGQQVAWCRREGTIERVKLSELYLTEALDRVDAGPEGAGPGDIIAVAGMPEVTIGETLADPDDPRPLPVIHIDEPSLSMTVGVNTSPLSGKEGSKLTARLIRTRLDQELVGNVSIRVLPTERPDTWEVQGRGELALAILVELMRREGFELNVGKPQVLTRTIDGRLHEPVERVSVDIPSDYLGIVTQLFSLRKGRMETIVNHGTGWCRMEWLVPARGLIGFRTEFMTETRGTGLLHHVFERYEPWHGDLRTRPTGSMVADRRGPTTTYALDEPAGAGRHVRGPGRRGVRGHDRRRELPGRRHGRQPDQGAQAHQHAVVDVGGAGPAGPPPQPVARAGPGVHPRGRVGRGHPVIGPLAQGGARSAASVPPAVARRPRPAAGRRGRGVAQLTGWPGRWRHDRVPRDLTGVAGGRPDAGWGVGGERPRRTAAANGLGGGRHCDPKGHPEDREPRSGTTLWIWDDRAPFFPFKSSEVHQVVPDRDRGGMEKGVGGKQAFDASVKDRLRRRFRIQYGVLSRAQANLDGATSEQIRTQLRAGEWERLYPGVYRHAAAPRCPEQNILAACLAVGPRSLASHGSAAWLWQLVDQPPLVPTITLPRPAHSTLPGIRVYRSSDLDFLRVLNHRRIPCTDPLRTLVDLAADVDPLVLDTAIDRALGRQLVTVKGLVAELGRLAKHGRRGVPQLRTALGRRGFIGAPHPSVLESRTARVFRAHGIQIPKPEFAAGPDGEYRLDYAMPEEMIALEVDGYVWHFSPEHKQRDEARRRRLVLEGWRPLVYTWVDVTRRPELMIREFLTRDGSAPAPMTRTT